MQFLDFRIMSEYKLFALKEEAKQVDIIIIFPVAYGTSTLVVPAIRSNSVPLVILNAHKDATRDYEKETTADYLHHEGVCCVPEFAGALKGVGRKFEVITGMFDDASLKEQLCNCICTAQAARIFKQLKVGFIGHIYPGMIDMPVDELKVLRTFGSLLEHIEVEEIVESFDKVSETRIKETVADLKQMFKIDKTIGQESLEFSIRIFAAFDEIIGKHNVDAFAFYWWGQDEHFTQIRAQSSLAVTLLTTKGIPGVTEGDIKTAIALKIVNLLGGGGTLGEFFAMDFAEDFILMGHDGPTNLKMASGKPSLINLDLLHGKTGYGLGIEMPIKPGPVTLLNLTQFDGDNLKLITTVGECFEGPVLRIGNPNSRIRIARPLAEFFSLWCAEGPTHHVAVGLGDLRERIRLLSETLGIDYVVV